MILNNAPANEAIVSNVGEIGEFRIRNSAKAFNILSSGLYANKVRAVIRELSCNAVDSHAAAGKVGTPFDVHLPNSLEPHFSIRDYGTGLTRDQVTQIYTTYFESTKTNSNEFIGALGLGSKSPFSYTDNFTVTAIRDGVKGIYTAFINEAGVPSIALMMSEETDEPAGVEVKFSVNDRYDFDKFRQEARAVYKYFALRPVISGNADFGFEDVEYDTKDIIPGVHSYKAGGRSHSIAIMGNIAYPIDIPQADNTLGDLRQLLGCGLEMHFGIGELDFQASREGLSYIPQTIASIKSKLEALNAALATVLAKESDAIPNLWDRAIFLSRKKEHKLWNAAVIKYATDTNLPTFDAKHGYGARCKTFRIKVEDMSKDWNIQIRQLRQSRGSKIVNNSKSTTEYADGNARDANGHYITWQEWHIGVDETSHFVINDLKTGAGERARYHYRETGCDVYSRYIYVLEKADKTKDMDLVSFFAAIQEPPTARRFAASTLKQREREKLGTNVTILKLEKRNQGSYNYRRSDEDMVWRDAGKADTFDASKTFYYVPLSGYQMQSSNGYGSGKELYEDVMSLPGLFSGTIYGVRKSDLAEVKKMSNWINFEEHIEQVLNGKDVSKLMMSLVKANLDRRDIFEFYNHKILPLLDDNSPYKKLVSVFSKVDKFTGNQYNMNNLFRRFAPSANLSPEALTIKYQQELDSVNSRYPLLSKLSTYRVEASDIADYVNLIDEKKGI
jgi:hypothetical protein